MKTLAKEKTEKANGVGAGNERDQHAGVAPGYRIGR